MSTTKYVFVEFYGDASAEPLNVICYCRTVELPPQMTNLNALIPILMHLFIFSVEKIYYLHKATSIVSCVTPNASQWEATLRDVVGFPTVYCRIYRRTFFTLSNQTSRYIRKCIRIMVLRPSQPISVLSSWSVYLTTLFLGRFSPLSG